jgi:hypothetical protein
MARSPPLAQTPEGRRKTRNKIVTALVVFAAIATWTLYSNVGLVSNSEVGGSSPAAASIVRVLPQALVGVGTFGVGTFHCTLFVVVRQNTSER